MKNTQQTLTVLCILISYSFEIQSSDSPQNLPNSLSDSASSIENSRAYFYNPSTEKLFYFAEFLYWKPVTNSFDWATVLQTIGLNLIPKSQICDDKDVSFSYAPGFRLGGGYQFKQGKFEVDSRPLQIIGTYERVTTNSSSNIKDLESNQLIKPIVPIVPVDPNSLELNYGQTKISLEYNRADLKMAWPLWASDSVIFRLNAGTTFAAINSKWLTEFGVDDIKTYTSNLKWSWWGAGLLGSGDVDIEIGKGFGIFANTSFAFLFGQMNTREKYRKLNTDQPVLTSARRQYFSFQPVFKFGVGIDYKHWYNSLLLYVSAGWELNYWFNLNQYGSVNSRDGVNNGSSLPLGSVYFLDTTPTSLSFQGLTVKIGVAY